MALHNQPPIAPHHAPVPALIVKPEPWGRNSTRYRVELADADFMTRTAAIFSTDRNAQAFAAYCVANGIYNRRDWVAKADHKAKRAYCFNHTGAGSLELSPFSR